MMTASTGSTYSALQYMLILLRCPLNKYIYIDVKVRHTDDDPIYYDHYDTEALHDILDTHHKITEYTT